MSRNDSASPLVSVVMPTYNQAGHIGGAMASVLAQSIKDLELIVVDNHSDDGTAEVVASMNDPRVRYERFRNHGIIAASRNVGLRAAGGRYVAFIDSDDHWEPDKLARQVEALENDPEAFMVYCRWRVLRGEEFTDEVRPALSDCASGRIFKRLFRKNFISSITVLMRNEPDKGYFFDEDPGLRAIEDYDLWLRVALEQKVLLVPDPLAAYRIYTGNTSKGVGGNVRRQLRLLRKWRPLVGLAPCLGKAAVLLGRLAAVPFRRW